MARPFKQGLEYFPLDVNILEDEKIRTLRYQYGPLGAYVYIHILLMIYKKGYYLEIDLETLVESLHMDIGQTWVRVDRLRMIVDACVEIGLFEEALVRQGVITSVAVQRQYILSTRRRKIVNVDKHWLLDRQQMLEIKVLLNDADGCTNEQNNSKKGVNVDTNLINVDINSQSKRKRKIDIIDKLDKGNSSKNYNNLTYPGYLNYFTKVLINEGVIDELNLDIPSFNKLFKEALEVYGLEDLTRATRYLCNYLKRPSVKVDDLFNFFKTALLKNLSWLNREGDRNGNFEVWIQELIQKLGKRNHST